MANTKPHKYSNKLKRMEVSSTDKVRDIARDTLSDFEESGSSDEECFQT